MRLAPLYHGLILGLSDGHDILQTSCHFSRHDNFKVAHLLILGPMLAAEQLDFRQPPHICHQP